MRDKDGPLRFGVRRGPGWEPSTDCDRVISQDVIDGSDRSSALQLSNLVEGTYTFHLRVADGHGASDTDTATVEVRPGACWASGPAFVGLACEWGLRGDLPLGLFAGGSGALCGKPGSPCGFLYTGPSVPQQTQPRNSWGALGLTARLLGHSGFPTRRQRGLSKTKGLVRWPRGLHSWERQEGGSSEVATPSSGMNWAGPTALRD